MCVTVSKDGSRTPCAASRTACVWVWVIETTVGCSSTGKNKWGLDARFIARCLHVFDVTCLTCLLDLMVQPSQAGQEREQCHNSHNRGHRIKMTPSSHGEQRQNRHIDGHRANHSLISHGHRHDDRRRRRRRVLRLGTRRLRRTRVKAVDR